MKTIRALAPLLLAVTFVLRAPAQGPFPVDASAAIPRTGNATFFAKHESFLARVKAGPVGLLFLGDSITAGWSRVPELWEARYGRYQPANFGSGGDHTHNLIWRIENGALDGMRPRVAVLMIGTNNSATHTGDEIAAANKKIVHLIREKLPQTKVLLLAILPRGPRTNRDGLPDPWQRRMTAIRAANAALAEFDDGRYVRFLDISPKLVAPDGTIPADIMPDQVHLSPVGYRIWAEAMQPLLDEMMK